MSSIAIKERPILFSAPMVRAILEGRKTQTRRVMKPQPLTESGYLLGRDYWLQRTNVLMTRVHGFFREYGARLCPYGGPSGRLWVRETFVNNFGHLLYRADCHPDSFEYGAKGWKPSIFMPRKLSRITLEITGVRAEQVQDISEDDIRAEGFDRVRYRGYTKRTVDDPEDFSDAWDAINGKRAPWKSNPWIWVLTFKRVTT